MLLLAHALSYSIDTSLWMMSSRFAASIDSRTSAPSACWRARVFDEPSNSTSGPTPPASVIDGFCHVGECIQLPPLAQRALGVLIATGEELDERGDSSGPAMRSTCRPNRPKCARARPRRISRWTACWGRPPTAARPARDASE